MKQYLKLMSLTVLFALIAGSKRLMAQESPVFKRKTEIKTFDVVQAAQVAIANTKLYANLSEGFVGTGL